MRAPNWRSRELGSLQREEGREAEFWLRGTPWALNRERNKQQGGLQNTIRYPVIMTALLPDEKTIWSFQVPLYNFLLVHRAHCGICHISLKLIDGIWDKTQVLLHLFSVWEKPKRASASFQIPFMGARLPNVKTHA